MLISPSFFCEGYLFQFSVAKKKDSILLLRESMLMPVICILGSFVALLCVSSGYALQHALVDLLDSLCICLSSKLLLTASMDELKKHPCICNFIGHSVSLDRFAESSVEDAGRQYYHHSLYAIKNEMKQTYGAESL